MYGSSSVYSTSQSTLESFKTKVILGSKGKGKGKVTITNSKSKSIRMEFKAMRPFGIKTGTLEFITNNSVLVTFGIVSNYTATLLITFPYSYFM
jgi:hypothetical protein